MVEVLVGSGGLLVDRDEVLLERGEMLVERDGRWKKEVDYC